MTLQVPQQGVPNNHFRHLPAGPRRPYLSRTTRLLAAASYLDPAYAGAVIDELIVDEHRAVAPSFFGVDLVPVATHALNARRLNIFRDLALVLVTIVCLALAWNGTAFWVSLILLIGLVRMAVRIWRRFKTAGRVAITVVAVYLVTTLVFLVISAAAQQSLSGGDGSSLDPYSPGGSQSHQSATDQLHSLLTGAHAIVSVLLLPVALYTTLLLFELHRYRLLAADFRLDRQHDLPRVGNARVQQRIAAIGTAQYGNVAMYSGFNPFIGAGVIRRSWSIEVDLVSTDPVSKARTPVPVDPVDLHRMVHDRLLALRDAPRSENERILGLVLDHHVVAEGTRATSDPLLDPHRRPYEFIPATSIAHLMRAPQGGIRYYQRVSVTAAGAPIRDEQGRLILEAQDQEVGSSVFFYVAVEGGMMYVELVSTVMPPIRPDYHAIDRLPASVRRNGFVRMLGSAARDLFRVAVYSPLHLVTGVVGVVRLAWRMQQTHSDVDEYLDYEFGARTSIRELAAADDFGTYIQLLDATKYTKLIEKCVNGAILDFLTSRDIDASDYRQQVTQIQNSGVMITNSQFSGQVVQGSTANTISQNPAAEPGRS